ncbi:hypothetical protein [Streptomyces sp. DH12]|uniref:zinc finger domain-containing protein n=1 Tax=Streptomyces sp. DH12 TaxID=2857010 RepID=UPI001E53A019|nr:hypothetical protein [Streptomyces sp. DH12]
MSRRIGRGGRKGQTHTATPTLRSYTTPPASAVTITRADGTVEVVPAQKPKATPKPTRRSRAKRSPVVCAICGRPIKGEPARSTERWTKGKPVHPDGTCVKNTRKAPKTPKTTPAARSSQPRAGRTTAEERRQILGDDVIEHIHREVAAAPAPTAEVITNLRRILTRPADGAPADTHQAPAAPAVQPAAWTQVTCPRCGAAPGRLCTVRSAKGTTVSSNVPHRERPQIVRRALAAARRRQQP